MSLVKVEGRGCVHYINEGKDKFRCLPCVLLRVVGHVVAKDKNTFCFFY